MSCDLTQGFTIGCTDNAGGVKRFLFATMPSDFAITQNVSGMVTAITGTALTYYAYEVTTGVGSASSFSDNNTVNQANGTSYVDQSALYVLNKMEQTKRNEVKILARAKMSVIVQDNNGKYWLMGATNGVRMTTGESGTGIQFGDRNGYSLTFGAQEPENSVEVDSSIIAALLV